MSASEARQILEENLEDIDSLEMLSEHLLHLAQYQRGGRVLYFEKIDPGEAAKRVHKKIIAVANKKNIFFTLFVYLLRMLSTTRYKFYIFVKIKLNEQSCRK